MAQMIFDTLKIMGIGVATVFAVLAIFYGLVKALLFFFPAKREKEGQES